MPVIILMDILDNSVVGADLYPLLFQTDPINGADPAFPIGDPTPVVAKHITTVPQWKRVNQQNVTRIQIITQEITGTLVPTVSVPANVWPATIVQFLLRKVSDAKS